MVSRIFAALFWAEKVFAADFVTVSMSERSITVKPNGFTATE